MITKQKIEDHPFPPFIPENATILIIGSFSGRDQIMTEPNNDLWFYGTKRNQFWTIISKVYNTSLITKDDKQKLFEKNGIGITDIFLKIKRKKPSNLDQHIDINESTYNDIAIKSILTNPKIKSVLFTSKFVEKHFNKKFPNIEGFCLPSPSNAANRSILKMESFKDYIKMDPKGTIASFRIYKYKELLGV